MDATEGEGIVGTTYLHAVTSLDGYIADDNDDVGRLHELNGLWVLLAVTFTVLSTPVSQAWTRTKRPIDGTPPASAKTW